MSIGATALAVLSALDEAANVAPVVLTFIESTVSAAEATGKSGTDKLTMVLNATETFLNSLLPNFSGDISTFLQLVEAFVGDLVELYNAGSIFVHDVKAAL